MAKVTTIAISTTLGTSFTTYTVPAGSTFVVRFINVANTTAGAVTVSAGAGLGGSAYAWFLNGVTVPAHTTLQYPEYTPISAGNVISALAGAVGSIDIYVTGDLISLG